MAENQADTVPLKLFWSPQRDEYFSVATESGERAANEAGYSFLRIQGYIYKREHPGTVPLKLFWSAQRQDNSSVATTDTEDWARRAGYTFTRVQGYIYPPYYGFCDLDLSGNSKYKGPSQLRYASNGAEIPWLDRGQHMDLSGAEKVNGCDVCTVSGTIYNGAYSCSCKTDDGYECREGTMSVSKAVDFILRALEVGVSIRLPQRHMRRACTVLYPLSQITDCDQVSSVGRHQQLVGRCHHYRTIYARPCRAIRPLSEWIYILASQNRGLRGPRGDSSKMGIHGLGKKYPRFSDHRRTANPWG